jgi:hypothetical protein
MYCAFLDNPLDLRFRNADQPADLYVIQLAEKDPASDSWSLNAETFGRLINCLELICHLFYPLERTSNALSPLLPAVRGMRGTKLLSGKEIKILGLVSAGYCVRGAGYYVRGT